MSTKIRQMNANDPEIINNAFALQGWKDKSIELFDKYLAEQDINKRITLIAEIDRNFAGYINVKWKSKYPFFLEKNIPEITDFNVLIKYRRLGIGKKLLNRAEEIVRERSDFAGIGVGLYSDYGAAQIMYIKNGYIPDGNGIYNDNGYIKPGETIIIDDDVTLYFIKKLR